MSEFGIVNDDILKWAASYKGEPYHALFCDPPYHLTSITERYGKANSKPSRNGKTGVYRRSSKGFMGKQWDGGDIAFRPETWSALAEHLYPGAFIMAFASTRGWHRMAVAIEDAGLIIEPTFYLWGFGSGFPKATRIKNAPDCLEGYRYGGQAIKPASEPVIVARKPYEGRPVDNIADTGAGAWNIDGGRIPTTEQVGWGGHPSRGYGGWDSSPDGNPASGRWPSNLILSHHPDCNGACVDGCAVRRLGEMSGDVPAGGSVTGDAPSNPTNHIYQGGYERQPTDSFNDQGTAARFFFQSDWSYEVAEQINNADSVFYTSKTPTSEREAGLDDLEAKTRNRVNKGGYERDPKWQPTQRKNIHPAVKPIKLTQYLATLLLPPAEYAPRRLLVPFSGSGSEIIGALLAGWDHVTGIEQSAEYAEIAQARCQYWLDMINNGHTDIDRILAASKVQKAAADTGQMTLI